jgi:hypothetical protein
MRLSQLGAAVRLLRSQHHRCDLADARVRALGLSVEIVPVHVALFSGKNGQWQVKEEYSRSHRGRRPFLVKLIWNLEWY